MTTTVAFSSPTLEILKLQVPDSQAHTVGNSLQLCGGWNPELLNSDYITVNCYYQLFFDVNICFSGI